MPRLSWTGLQIAFTGLVLLPGRLTGQEPVSVAKSPPAESVVADTGLKAAQQKVSAPTADLADRIRSQSRLLVAPAVVQGPDSSSAVSWGPHSWFLSPPPASVHVIRWYEPLAVLGGVALTATLDEPVANHFRDHRSQSGEDLADAWSKFGTVGVGVMTTSVLVGGLISQNHKVTHAGLRLLFSAGLAGVAAEGIKFMVGRERPNETTSAGDFDAGTGDAAFPSGHASLAFAMAASLSDDLHRTWATVGLYTVATGVGIARVYLLEHWVSDVVGGAALGITSAKLVSGRWQIFGLRPPGFLVTPAGAKIVWHASF